MATEKQYYFKFYRWSTIRILSNFIKECKKIGVFQVAKNNILWCKKIFIEFKILLLTLEYPYAILTKLTLCVARMNAAYKGKANERKTFKNFLKKVVDIRK